MHPGLLTVQAVDMEGEAEEDMEEEEVVEAMVHLVHSLATVQAADMEEAEEEVDTAAAEEVAVDMAAAEAPQPLTAMEPRKPAWLAEETSTATVRLRPG